MFNSEPMLALIVTLTGGGILAHLLMRVSGRIVNFLRYGTGEDLHKFYLNELGEAGTGGAGAGEGAGAEGKGAAGAGKGGAFTQEQVDHIVQERLGRERQKFGDYEDLKKFKETHEQELQKKNQEDLVKAKKYEEAEGTYKKQLSERDQIIQQKDTSIRDLKISHVLSNEISNQNGFIEESLALLRSNAEIDQAGNVTIKIKDANGIEKSVPVAEGVKQFLGGRPHLVRASHKQGSGTGAGDHNGNGGQGGGNGTGEDLNSLNSKYQSAMNRGDYKGAREIQKQIRSKVVERTPMALK